MSAFRIGTEAANPAYSHGRRAAEADYMASDDEPAPTARERFQSVFDKLTKWIPSDTLAVYVPGVTVLAADGGQPSVRFLVLMILVTPLFVILAAFATGKTMSGKVWLSAGLAAVAFAIWSMSVPLSGWQSAGFVANNEAAAAVGAAIAGVLFGYLADGIVKRVPADG